uniref:Grh/CP2 DB domain-containing protein n=1 Tax=Trichobilharzia regenti TaxID=157069 RepID=A0AA85KH28_TRIRE|nr:unnamed protein product [Trichobilharzia regenti]
MAENSSWSFDEADLSACFDDTMNGIGVGVNSMFNMRDALSALPLCKEESKISDDSKYGNQSKFTMFTSNSAQTVADIFASISDADTSPQLFGNILVAPTSSVTRLGEASLTYLNQGQTYELKLNLKTPEITFIKTYIRVTFHDKQMELKEREYWNGWRQIHQGENLLDIDYGKSSDYEELDMEKLSSDVILCIWKYPTCNIGLRFNCVSTEFTAKKHGGEKGIPFRFQVDHFDYDTNQHLESFGCQIKVFKMKGADRKHRTDRERIGRKSNDDQTIYKPSVPVTKLSFLPTKQVKLYHPNHYPCRSISDKELHCNSSSLTDKLTDKVLNSSLTTLTTTSNCSAKLFKADINDLVIENSMSKKLFIKDSFSLKDVDNATDNFATLPDSIETPTSNIQTFSEFVTPTYPYQQATAYSTLRNLSPGMSPSPSSNRQSTGPIQPCLQRRRRPRVSDCCVGACSSCGRSCRSASRWVRSNKNRIMSANWDNTVNRVKQATLISERRRAVHGCEASGHLPETQKSKVIHVKIPFHSTNSKVAVNTSKVVCNLSTSGESSSLGNEEFSKWTFVDKFDDKSSSPSIIVSDYPINSIQRDRDPLLGMSSATPASCDTTTGYCSNEIHASSDETSLTDRVLDEIRYCPEDNDNDSPVVNDNAVDADNDDSADAEAASTTGAGGTNAAAVALASGDNESLRYAKLCLNKSNSLLDHADTSHRGSTIISLTSSSHHHNHQQRQEGEEEEEVRKTSTAGMLNESSSSGLCSTDNTISCRSSSSNTNNSNSYTLSVVHCDMTALQITDWLCQSNFENLVETFKNFTGRDMLRLAKEDLLSICGSLEGLRLYNSLYNKPAVPRCTLYMCLKGEIIYHAVMLYEMTMHELHSRLASILSCRQDHIKIICLIAENDIPVLLTDEIISVLIVPAYAKSAVISC